MIRLLFLVSLALLAGCYSYAPVELNTIRTGTTVRAHLAGERTTTMDAISRRAPRTGVLEGRVLETGVDRLLLAVPMTQPEPNSRVGALHQRVRLSSEQVRSLEIKRLDRMRTGALVGVLAGGLAYLAHRVLGREVGGSTEPSVSQPQEAQVPGLSW